MLLLPTARHSFLGKIALTILLIGIGDTLFYRHELSHGWLGLFGLTLLVGLALARPAIWRSRPAIVALLAAAASAAAMIYDANLLAFALFWLAAALATLLPATARFDDGWRWFQRLLAHGVIALFGPIIDFARLSRVRRRRPATGPGLRTTAPALILPVLGSAVFIALFAAANPVIEAWIDSLSIPSVEGDALVRLILWAFLTLAAWSLLRPRVVRNLLPRLTGDASIPLPGVTPASVLLSLLAFNLLFAVQNGMDLAWLWGLMPLPDKMTLADYAHRGAYPLILTALLAGLFVLVTLRPCSATANVPAIRALVTVWIAQNLVLVASSMLRTIDYVDAYSLTRLRIAALAWMALVAAGLILICLRLIWQRSGAWLINANLGAAAVLLGAYAWVDTGAVAAQWNVRHAREVDGTGANLDLCYLQEMGSSALLPLLELEQAARTSELRARVSNIRQEVHWSLRRDLEQGAWTLLGSRRLRKADALVAAAALPQPAPLRTPCYGPAEEDYAADDAAQPAAPALTTPKEQ